VRICVCVCVSLCRSLSLHLGQPPPPISAMRANLTAHCSTLQHTAVHCNTLQHIATPCTYTPSPSPHTAIYCNTLQHTATHYNTPQPHTHLLLLHHTIDLLHLIYARTHGGHCNGRVGCSVFRCVAVSCIVLQWPIATATQCKKLQHTETQWTLQHTETQCGAVLHCIAVAIGHCNGQCYTMQHTAPHCSTLQHTAT